MRFLVPGLVVLFCACGAEPAQTWIFLHADPLLAPEANQLQLTITSSGEEVLERTDPVDRSVLGIANLFLVPKDGDVTRTFEIQAKLQGGSVTVPALVVNGGYTAESTRVINAHFDDSGFCDIETSCGEGQTCEFGRCVGACFAGSEEGAGDGRDFATCGECTRCAGGECEPLADGTACGCAGDACTGGRCVPVVAVQHVRTGEASACAGTDDGSWCWGNAFRNMTAQGLDVHTDRPQPLEGPLVRGLQQFVVGAEFACARWTRSGPTTGRTCWGWANTGTFAMGELGGVSDPTELPDPPGEGIIDYQAGRFFTCALRADSVIQCAGSNTSQQLGFPYIESAVPNGTEKSAEWVTIGDQPWQGLAVGNTSVCGLRGGSAYCWGQSSLRSGNSEVPECIPAPDGECATFISSVAIQEERGCGLDEAGRAYCWGDNTGGLLGVDGVELLASASPVNTALRFRSIALGPRGSICAIGLDSGLYCWGANTNAQLGTGDRVQRTSPERIVVDPGDSWTAVSMARDYTCAIRSDFQLYCWGSNGLTGGTVAREAVGRLGLGLGANGTNPDHGVVVTRPTRVCFSRE